MQKSEPDESRPKSHLDEISTRWSQVGDPMQFVMRYGPAIQKYLAALIGNPDDAADVAQDFLANMLTHRFAQASPDQGKFRKYLKAAVRNAALMHFRRKRATQKVQSELADEIANSSAASPADDEWLAAWQRCVVERAWSALHREQRRSADGMYYTVLRIATDHADDDTATQASRASKLAGRPIRPDTFRKQLSRARRLFAELLVREVALTVQPRTPEAVEAELVETRLMPIVKDFLPADWKSQILSGQA